MERIMEMPTAILTLKKGRQKPVLNRHPWIFSGAIQQVQGDPAPGDIVDIADHRQNFLARAYYNPHSQIQARILSWNPAESIDDVFWRRGLERAGNGRFSLNLQPHTNAFRLINAEADGLPGLIVDKYGDYLVMQCLTLGIDRRKEQLIPLLAELFQPQGIFERSDVDVRTKEGLAASDGLVWGKPPPRDYLIQENGLTFGVDLHEGHKTGFYLDQRENRALVGQPYIVAGQTILNLFAYTGGFAVYAAAAGAGRIINVDTSAEVLAQAERNIERNGWQRPQDEYLAGDAFEVLRYYRDEGEQFDVIILDPPKFAHSRRDVDNACRGYKDLNWLAFRLLRPGGWLATFSCSGLVSADLFQKVLFGAAVDAGRHAQILRPLSQGADHPVALTFPESAYLKGFLCRVW
jgi:23S rRNA (cytosine1962-C5)-methyltransferase